MVFQPTSPVKSFSVVQRAATINRKPKAEPSTMVSTVSSKGRISDSMSSELFQADNQRISQLSTYTANTGGRARTSWTRVGSLFKRSSEALRAENKLTKPNPSATVAKDLDSPTDPMYDPETKTFRAELPAKEKKVFEKRMSKETTKSPIDAAIRNFKTSSPKIDMPPIAVTGPDEPKSFLDLDSSSDEDSPVLQRASSVRVSKPQIVLHNSTSAARIPKIRDSAQPSLSIDKSGQLLGENLKGLYNLTSGENDESTGSPADALAILEGTNFVDGSTVALPPTPPSRSDTPKESSIKETVVEVPTSAPEASSYTTTTPTPSTGIKSRSASIHPASSVKYSSSSTTPVFNPLRANPLSDREREHTRLSRTMSAPLPPNRNPNRRVTIRPADLIIHHSENDHRLFRESVVTTPYPNRLSMVNETNENRLSTTGGAIDFDEKHPHLEWSTISPDLTALPIPNSHHDAPLSITLTPIETKSPSTTGNRFPSPSSHEHLFLTLTLAPPSTASTTVEIQIRDRATFDDEQLFHIMRAAYLHNLLGLKRRVFFSRTISHILPGGNDMHLDGAGFMAHLSRPSRGRNKKGWLIWLRDQQVVAKRASSLFSSHDGQHHQNGNGNGKGHAHSHSNVSAYWSPTPTSAVPVPRMPFSRPQSRDLPPRVTLHYRFSVLAIFLVLLCVALLSVSATVLWVLFGVPGQAAGESVKETIFGEVGWRREAEFRVLTGLVLGLVVWVLGGVGVGGWVFGGWVLL